MEFYCPSCQKTVETDPQSTVTTKFNQIFYKASCPTCAQDMAVHENQPSTESLETTT